MMSGIPRERFNQIQSEAMKMVSDIGIDKLDAMPQAVRKPQLAVLYRLVEEQEQISYGAARRHIAKAMRRQRHPDNTPEQGWGGKRDGAGVKAAMQQADKLTDYGRNEP